MQLSARQCFMAVCLYIGLMQVAVTCKAQEPLPRRIALGVQAKSVSAETQQRLKLRNLRGVEVVSVIPDSTADTLGLLPGDVIDSMQDEPIKDVAGFVEQVGKVRVGTELRIKMQRADGPIELKAMPKPLPLETSTEFEIEYGQVNTFKGRLRTVVTYPKGGSKLPGVLLLAGLGLGSIEHPFADPLGMKTIASELTRKGLAVMRVDRPGCGDSEGGAARNADFDSVLAGYVAAAEAFKKHASVDADKITLLGFSAGGVEAPLVAAKVPVQGIAVFGCLDMSWQEYLQSTTRRQLRLAGVKPGEIDQAVAIQSIGWNYLINKGMTPDDIASKYPELSEWVDENWVDGKYFSGIHYSFYQQLGKANIAGAWDKFNGRVLAMWGDQDIVTSKEEHERLASLANKRQAGLGTYATIPGVDHNLRSGAAPASAAVIEAVMKWLN